MARRGENIYKRKDNRYEGRYIKFYDVSGKAVYGSVYSKSYSEVKKKLAKCKAEKQKTLPCFNIQLCEWLEIWLKSQGTLKSTTKKIYKSHIKNHINAAIGSVPLKKLDNSILQNFINSLDLSASTVKTILSVLTSALSAAEERGYIANVWNGLKTPKKEKSIVRILSVAEQQKLENVLTEKEDIGILICLYTGLRIGELCALRWSDVDLEAALLTVNGTQIRTDNGLEITTPKSKMSKREIPIPSFLNDKLKALPRKTDFVLSKDSNSMDIRTYRRHFKNILKHVELPDIKFHSLRHTFATRALEVGMDYRTLSEILGHSSVGITLDLYAHSLKEHKVRQMNKLNDLYRQ